jgi:hypothetical protein
MSPAPLSIRQFSHLVQRLTAFRPHLTGGLALSGESLYRVRNTTYQYQKYIFCQYQEGDCENYLFKDYDLKSGRAIGILKLMTSPNVHF